MFIFICCIKKGWNLNDLYLEHWVNIFTTSSYILIVDKQRPLLLKTYCIYIINNNVDTVLYSLHTHVDTQCPRYLHECTIACAASSTKEWTSKRISWNRSSLAWGRFFGSFWMHLAIKSCTETQSNHIHEQHIHVLISKFWIKYQ